MRQRLPLILSATALVIAVFGSTPVGQATVSLARSIPPFAKKAGFATKAGVATNALALNGHKASATGGAGHIPVLDSGGKLPASVVTSLSVVDRSLTLTDLGGPDNTDQTDTESTAISLAAGVCVNHEVGSFNPPVGLSGASVLGDMVIGTLTNATGAAAADNRVAVAPSMVIETSQGGAIVNLLLCNASNTAETIPAGSVFHWRIIGS